VVTFRGTQWTLHRSCRLVPSMWSTHTGATIAVGGQAAFARMAAARRLVRAALATASL
jgi:hypothetical protein